MPEANHIVRESNGIYSAWEDNTEDNLLGYIVLGEADGYGGPLMIAVAMNPSGIIIGAFIVSHKETPAWIRLIQKHELPGRGGEFHS